MSAWQPRTALGGRPLVIPRERGSPRGNSKVGWRALGVVLGRALHMCGIAGCVGPDAATGPVEQMLATIPHRGPDGQGIVGGEGIVLGHRRLSILDLSSHGAQPMTRGAATVTFNGEIYNYVELRAELQGLGHRFRTDTDTEVLLAAYQEWHFDCVDHLNGMWAFALHDSDERIIFCSRDRFGEKPFLFHASGSTVVFGSEVKQFQRIGIGTQPDLETVKQFLVLGAKSDGTATFNAGIHNLPPGTNLVISCTTGDRSSWRYYSPGTLGLFDGMQDADVPALLDIEFHRAVTMRLRSDVPVGMLLSGGIDSSLVASVAGPAYLEATGRPLVAVTALSGDPRNDEAAHASSVAQAAHLAWEPVNVPATATREAWTEATRVIEQPLGSSSHVLQLNVMRRAKEVGCTVVLDGQGADESWMGYPRYTMTAVRQLPWPERPAFAWRSADTTGLGPARWLAYSAYFGVPDVAYRRMRRRLRPLGLSVPRSWYMTRFVELTGKSGSPVSDLQSQQLAGEQLGALLRYADRTSMAASVEDRLPFLDYRLVELAMATPAACKFKGGWTKWPLRQQLARTMPEAIAWRKGKIGFEAAGASFQPDDPSALATIRASKCLSALGVRLDRLDDVERSVLWRMFAIALWESACMNGSPT